MISTEEIAAGDQLRRYGRILVRNAGLVLSCMLVAAVAAAAFTYGQDPSYVASATVLIQQSPTEQVVAPDNQSGRDFQRRLDSEVEILRSGSVANAAASRLGHTPRVKVESVGQTNTIRVTATARQPDVAAADANAYAQAYVDASRERSVSDLRAGLADVEAEIREIDQRMAASRSEAEKAALNDERSYYARQRERLEVSLGLASRGGPQLIDTAEPPNRPASPDPVRNVTVGVLLGLLVGVAGAFLRDNLDESIRSKSQLEAIVPSLPVLGMIPRELQRKAFRARLLSRRDQERVGIAHPHSAVAESHRMLRASLQFLRLESRSVKTIQVTSAQPGDGKTSTAANLAVVLAASGLRVVVVCCDWHKPRLHECFGLENRVGFTSVLLGEATIEEVVQKPAGLKNLLVLASGPTPPNPSELLGSIEASETIAALRDAADIVIIDSPPVLPVSDAVVLAPMVDATLIIARSGATSQKGFRRAVELLEQVDANLIGAVLVGVVGEDAYNRRYGYAGYDGNHRGGTAAREQTTLGWHASSERGVQVAQPVQRTSRRAQPS